MPKIIDDPVLWDALFEYAELGDFYEYDIENEEFRLALSKMEEFTVNIKRNGKFTEETLKQLNLLLEHMESLKDLMLRNTSNERMDVTSIFEHVTSNIERIIIRGFDLTDGIGDDSIKRLEKVKEFSVSKCNIPKIPVFPKDDCQITLGEKTIEIPDWECIDFATNPEIKNKLHVYGRYEASRMIWALNGSPIPLSLYEKYKEFIPRYDNICILIGDISELSIEDLEKLKTNPSVKNIAIEGGEYSTNENNWYSIEEYTAVLKEVDKIRTQINLPDKDDEDREKKIFAQVYKILGKRINYDHYAVGESGKLDEELKYSCRNMKNGLIGTERNGQTEYLSVCAGYADILRNVLSYLGIKSDYISSRSEAKFEYRDGGFFEKRDEAGKTIYMNGTTDPMGHAYNIVELDGQKFYCDLTWDASNIKVDRYPLANFLNSYEQFVKSHDQVGFNEKIADKEANFALPLDAQMELFGEIAKDDISQMMQENYLSGFVSCYLESTKQDSKGHEAKKFLDMIKFINQVEQAIFTMPEGRWTNMGVNIGNETFVFETSDKSKLRDMKQDIHRKRRRESGHESR